MGEQGPLHAPEFTMIEWYRANADWTQVIADTLGAILKYQDDIQRIEGGEAKKILEDSRAALEPA